MKYAILATVLALASIAFALDGQFGIHDPSTVVLCDGKNYTYGSGGTPFVSDDGWIWRAGVRPSPVALPPAWRITWSRRGFEPVLQESPGAHSWFNRRNYLIEFAPQLFQCAIASMRKHI